MNWMTTLKNYDIHGVDTSYINTHEIISKLFLYLGRLAWTSGQSESESVSILLMYQNDPIASRSDTYGIN